MKKYAEQNPIMNEDSDEELMKYLKENVSKDFFEKISSMAKNKNQNE